ncbi:conserved hypothetical protein [Frankia sp. AiPs1]|uniref:hypothetical protein n=1 Tax=Frankia sp. AiPa1 TaxID=573492 RepID=UPI00202AF241|nr:hypothetical protein [Frankia sp. AiPa1]MCL9757929.1 hypothetical protein [Frankia sp. AiPa1]
MPDIRGEFRLANVFDGTADGVPYIIDRPLLPPGPERGRFLRYLNAGALVFRAAGLGTDQLEPNRGKQVPIVALTDGEWIWTASVVYYLEEHDLPPEPAFLEYLRGRDFRYEAPSKERVAAALAATRSR